MNDIGFYLFATALIVLFYGEPNIMSGLIAMTNSAGCTP